MHVPNVDQVFLVFARDADGILPLVHEFEDLFHRRRRERRRPFGEAANKLVQEFLRADLEVERVTAVFDEDVEELWVGGWAFRFPLGLASASVATLRSTYVHRPMNGAHGGTCMESEHGDMRVPVVDQANDFHRRLARTARACGSVFLILIVNRG